jgi:hypothetical protein
MLFKSLKAVFNQIRKSSNQRQLFKLFKLFKLILKINDERMSLWWVRLILTLLTDLLLINWLIFYLILFHLKSCINYKHSNRMS